MCVVRKWIFRTACTHQPPQSSAVPTEWYAYAKGKSRLKSAVPLSFFEIYFTLYIPDVPKNCIVFGFSSSKSVWIFLLVIPSFALSRSWWWLPLGVRILRTKYKKHNAIRCDARPFFHVIHLCLRSIRERIGKRERARGNQSRVNVLRLFVYGQSSCQSVVVSFVSTIFE